MVVLGGVTRLTGSGLSMVDWEPISGVVPPISNEDWEVEFDNYRASPEYVEINWGMDIAAFKVIFYFEYGNTELFNGYCHKQASWTPFTGLRVKLDAV